MRGFERDDDLYARGVEPLIEPDRLYGFSVAAQLIPSDRATHIDVSTLRKWWRQGRFEAELRPGRTKPSYFIRGSELLKLIQTFPVRCGSAKSQAPPVRSRPELERSEKVAVAYFEGIYGGKI